MVVNSPLKHPKLDNGFRDANPMAGFYLESFLKRHGFDARSVFDWSDDQSLEVALSTDPVAIALSTTYITDNALLEACLSTIRRVAPDVPVVVGGPYIWKQKIEYARDSGASYRRRVEAKQFGVDLLMDCLFGCSSFGCLGEAVYIAHEFGEYTLLRVLRALAEGKRRGEALSEIPNLVLPTPDGAWHHTPTAAEPVDLEEDFTRWELVEEMPSMVPIRSSVGCPYRCRYCDFIELHPAVRMRSAESIVREVESAKRRSARFFGFIDDNIFLSKRRIRELTTAFTENSLGVTWGGFFRVDRIDESNIEDLALSGCRFGLCGIESLDDEQLVRLRKNCEREEVVRGVELATSAGMNVNLSLLVGFPGETKRSIDQTIDHINCLSSGHKGFASWLAYPLYVLPGTAVDEIAYRRQFGLVGRRNTWRHETMSGEEAGTFWSNYLHDSIDQLPYHYYAGDVPSYWSPGRRQRGFTARRDLTRCFVRGLSDEQVQCAFQRLYEEVRDSSKPIAAPSWQDVFAERQMQPGMRDRYRGAF
ncbi:MAG: B12-binding domain-containing radical SAM protein [Myxococcota bacterium]